MKKNKKEELVAKIEKVVEIYKQLDSTCEKAHELGLLDYEGEMHDSIWGAFEGLLDMVDDENHWLAWHIWDNSCGEDGKLVINNKNKGIKIKTPEDLAWIILSEKKKA